MISAQDRLIVALDVPDAELAHAIVISLQDRVLTYKIGPWLTLARGFEGLLDRLFDEGKQIFIDTKGIDIPETMRAGVRAAVKRGVHFLTIYGNDDVSCDTLESLVDEKRDSSLKLLMVTVLTSMKSSNELVLKRAFRAINCGIDGVITSGYEAGYIKEEARRLGKKCLVITPGIRLSPESFDDQLRIMSPYAAIINGADYLVVGRPIITAADPLKVTTGILDQMQIAFDTISLDSRLAQG